MGGGEAGVREDLAEIMADSSEQGGAGSTSASAKEEKSVWKRGK